MSRFHAHAFSVQTAHIIPKAKYARSCFLFNLFIIDVHPSAHLPAHPVAQNPTIGKNPCGHLLSTILHVGEKEF